MRWRVGCRFANALVAQWIERLTTDQKVGGSSPSERARKAQLRVVSRLVADSFGSGFASDVQRRFE